MSFSSPLANIQTFWLKNRAQDRLQASRKAIAASGDRWRVMMRF
jgi:hypothetical protein